ncbi:MAG: Maf family protein [Firmicutes bacterium]|nr:Maf family protein [Bacillota bacterium]
MISMLQQIEWYVDNEEFIDKAGSYSIQGLAAAFIPRIDGCYYNVVGLPIQLLWTMLVKYQQETAKII